MSAHPSIEADAASHSHKGTLCIDPLQAVRFVNTRAVSIGMDPLNRFDGHHPICSHALLDACLMLKRRKTRYLSQQLNAMHG